MGIAHSEGGCVRGRRADESAVLLLRGSVGKSALRLGRDTRWDVSRTWFEESTARGTEVSFETLNEQIKQSEAGVGVNAAVVNDGHTWIWIGISSLWHPPGPLGSCEEGGPSKLQREISSNASLFAIHY